MQVQGWRARLASARNEDEIQAILDEAEARQAQLTMPSVGAYTRGLTTHRVAQTDDDSDRATR